MKDSMAIVSFWWGYFLKLFQTQKESCFYLQNLLNGAIFFFFIRLARNRKLTTLLHIVIPVFTNHEVSLVLKRPQRHKEYEISLTLYKNLKNGKHQIRQFFWKVISFQALLFKLKGPEWAQSRIFWPKF